MSAAPWRALDEIAQVQNEPFLTPERESARRAVLDRVELLTECMRLDLKMIRHYFESRCTAWDNRQIRAYIAGVRALRNEIRRLTHPTLALTRQDRGRLEPWTSGDPNFARRART